MAKVKFTKTDREHLKSMGMVEGRPETIPENISPVLKQQIIDEWAEKGK